MSQQQQMLASADDALTREHAREDRISNTPSHIRRQVLGVRSVACLPSDHFTVVLRKKKNTFVIYIFTLSHFFPDYTTILALTPKSVKLKTTNQSHHGQCRTVEEACCSVQIDKGYGWRISSTVCVFLNK